MPFFCVYAVASCSTVEYKIHTSVLGLDLLASKWPPVFVDIMSVFSNYSSRGFLHLPIYVQPRRGQVSSFVRPSKPT